MLRLTDDCVQVSLFELADDLHIKVLNEGLMRGI